MGPNGQNYAVPKFFFFYVLVFDGFMMLHTGKMRHTDVQYKTVLAGPVGTFLTPV